MVTYVFFYIKKVLLSFFFIMQLSKHLECTSEKNSVLQQFFCIAPQTRQFEIRSWAIERKTGSGAQLNLIRESAPLVYGGRREEKFMCYRPDGIGLFRTTIALRFPTT